MISIFNMRQFENCNSTRQHSVQIYLTSKWTLIWLIFSVLSLKKDKEEEGGDSDKELRKTLKDCRFLISTSGIQRFLRMARLRAVRGGVSSGAIVLGRLKLRYIHVTQPQPQFSHHTTKQT